MLHYNILSISLAQIQMFLAVADDMSYTRAARRISVSQSMLSKNIAAIEKMLGLLLFVREAHSIRLTPAGRYLHQRWSTMLLQIESDISKANILQTGSSEQISIGNHSAGDQNFFFYPLIQSFKAAYPGIVVQIEINDFPELRQGLITGSTDVIFTSLFESEDLAEGRFSTRLMLETPLAVVMLKSNPLASRSSISIADLAAQRFVVNSSAQVPAYISMLTKLCAEAGFRPQISRYITSAQAILVNLQGNDEVAIVDRMLRGLDDENFRFFELEGTSSGAIMVWQTQTQNTAVQKFIDFATDYLKVSLFQ